LDNIINLFTYYPDTIVYFHGFKDGYYYDTKGNMNHKDHLIWNGIGFDNYRKDTYVYDNNNFMQSDIQQTWNISTFIYDNTVKDVFTSNGNNKTTVSGHYTWHIGFEDWWIGDDGLCKTFYYFTSPNQIKKTVLPGSELIVKIWPNPVSTNGVNVDYELANAGDVRVVIYSIDGKIINNLLFPKQMVGMHHNTINVSDLEKGIYMINISAGGLKHVEKMIVTK